MAHRYEGTRRGEHEGVVSAIVGAIRAVKADDESLKLQNEFYDEAKHPNDTKQ